MSYNDQELEAKFCILNPNSMEERLKQVGAKQTHPRMHEYNLRFDTPNQDLTHQHRLLRLRKDSANHLTYKGPATIHSGVISREEIEFTVGDFDTATTFLHALGYKINNIYEKYRTTYQLDELHITLDELPYGIFVEIEGPNAEGIKAVASKLGLNWDAHITDNYLGLFKRAQKALGLDFDELTFENFEKIDVGLDALGVSAADV